MIVMLDTNDDLEICEKELNCPVEQLLTPLTRYKNRHPENRFAIDNGAFSRFDRKAFESLLEREYPRRELCRFVSVPDVVGSARRTLEVFDYWYPILADHWKLAFVCQDGQEDLPIPFDFIDAVFIGGSTRWKESQSTIDCIKAAKLTGKWVHVGRINSPSRFVAFREIGADSCDGSGLAQFSWQRLELNSDPPLFKRTELLVDVAATNSNGGNETK